MVRLRALLVLSLVCSARNRIQKRYMWQKWRFSRIDLRYMWHVFLDMYPRNPLIKPFGGAFP